MIPMPSATPELAADPAKQDEARRNAESQSPQAIADIGNAAGSVIEGVADGTLGAVIDAAGAVADAAGSALGATADMAKASLDLVGGLLSGLGDL